MPDVYQADKEKKVCLYTETEFYEVLDLLVELSYMLEDTSRGKYRLYYKYLDLIEDEDIKYEDDFDEF